MNNEFSKLQELLKQEKERKDAIETEIKKQKQELIELGDKYEAAIINDQDQEAESYLTKMNQLRNSLKLNEDKLELINKRLVNPQIEAQADKALKAEQEKIDEINRQLKELSEKYHQLRQQMLEIPGEISKIRANAHTHIHRIEYIANTLPEWAKKQHTLRYSDIVDRYKYTGYISNPSLQEVTYRHLLYAKMERI